MTCRIWTLRHCSLVLESVKETRKTRVVHVRSVRTSLAASAGGVGVVCDSVIGVKNELVMCMACDACNAGANKHIVSMQPVVLAALLLLVAAVSAAPASNEELLSELKHLRDTSGTKDGVIHFNDDMLTRFGGKSRTYSLVVFLTANQVMDNPQLQMQKLRTEFGLASKAFLGGPTPDDAFFVDMLFEESPRIFRSVKANQVCAAEERVPRSRSQIRGACTPWSKVS